MRRTALVTGGGRGTGRAIARALARDGLAVAVAARTGDQVEAVAGELAVGGGGVLAVRLVRDGAANGEIVVRDGTAPRPPRRDP